MKTHHLLLAALSFSIASLVAACSSSSSSAPPPPVPVIADINGGASGSGSANSPFIIDGSGFGNQSTLPASGYVVNFANASGVVAASAVATTWTDTYIKATVPATLTAGSTYEVTVKTPGGTSNNTHGFLITSSVAFSPSTISWSGSTALPASVSALPVALSGFPTLTANITGTSGVVSTYMYTLGGNTATSGAVGAKNANVATANYSPVNTAPSLPAGCTSLTPCTSVPGPTGWAATTALPSARGFSAAVLANAYNSLFTGNGSIYVLGGLDATGTATNTVYQSTINADGTLGTWNSLTNSLPVALYGHAAVAYRGRIYVTGGNDSTGTPVNTVYAATINADGTLGAWATLGAMPAAISYHSMTAIGGYLYTIGGETAVTDPVSKTTGTVIGAVNMAQVNLADGTLIVPTGATIPWLSAGASLGGSGREKMSATVAGAYILVSGGLPSTSLEETYTSINANGTVSSFNGATGSKTISGATGGYSFYNHASTFFADTSGGAHMVILGGGDDTTGIPHVGVWVTP